MKKFKFALDTVLSYKQQVLGVRQGEHAEAAARVRAQEELLEKLREIDVLKAQLAGLNETLGRRPEAPAVDGSNDRNDKEEDGMVYYERLGDVADSYKTTIRKLMERGALRGRSDPDPDSLEDNVLNISEEYCRVMATLDKLGVLG